MKSYIILILAFFLGFVSCKKDEVITSGSKLLIGKEYFNDYPADPVMISNAEISGDVLTITIGASCCSVDTWVTNLVGSETVLYSSPPQRMIRLSFKNAAMVCDMFCGKTVQFDLTPTKLNNTNKIILNLSGWDSPLIYNY